MPIYKIYMDTCLKTNKSYIGYTKHDPKSRWSEKVSKSKNPEFNYKLVNAIRKHGFTEWTHDVLYSTKSLEHVLEIEVFFINEYDTFNSGYNSTIGGETPLYESLTDTHKKSISRGLKRAYITGHRTPVKHDDQTREIIRNKKRTGTWHTPIGDFSSCRLAANAMNTHHPNIRNWCKRNHVIIRKEHVTKVPHVFQTDHIGMSLEAIGFSFSALP